MPAAAEGIVRPPAEDQPALADPITETLLNVLARLTRRRMAAGIYLPIGLAGVAWLISPVMRAGPGFVVVLSVLGVCVLAALGQAIGAYVRFGRWVRRAEPMLRVRAWRPVPAVVTERGVIEVQEGDTVWRLRTRRLPGSAAELIARTRRVWLVGPDAKGWLSFRVDGSRMPFPARRARVPAASAPREPALPATTGTAADDPVPSLAAGEWRRILLRAQWMSLFVPVVTGTLAVGLSTMTVSATGWVVLAVLLLAFWMPALVRFRRASRDYLGLPALLAAGPWRRVSIQLVLWDMPARGTVAATRGTIQLEDGTELNLAIKGSVSLLGTIDETGTAWVAGEPLAGSKVAVGFPGYPLLGVAELS